MERKPMSVKEMAGVDIFWVNVVFMSLSCFAMKVVIPSKHPTGGV